MGNFLSEMFYRNEYVNKKYTEYRRKYWSAPMLMSVFIIISMLAVFSFEQIGLFKKENNLDTAMHVGKIQQTRPQNIENLSVMKDISEQMKVNTESKIIKEKQQEKMMNILIEGLEVD